MEELGTKNPRSQNDASEGEQISMGLLDSFATLLGSSPTLGERRRTKEKPQRTSW